MTEHPEIEFLPLPRLNPCRTYISSLAAVKHAVAQVNCDLGFLDPLRAAAIQQAAREVSQGLWNGRFASATSLLDPGTYLGILNSILTQRATHTLTSSQRWARYWQVVQVEEHVCLAQSDYNVVSTAMRIGCLSGLNSLLDAVHELVVSLRASHDQDLAGSLDHNANCLGRMAEGLHRLAWVGVDGHTELSARLDYQSRLARRLSEETRLTFLEADPSSGPAQFVLELARFLSALRALTASLTRLGNRPRPRPESSSSTRSAGDGHELQAGQALEEARFRLQVCDMTVVLAAFVGQSEMERILPVLACNLFEEMQALTIAMQWQSESSTSGSEAVRFDSRQLQTADHLMLQPSHPTLAVSRVPSWVSR
jgi:fumarate hydratase class II